MNDKSMFLLAGDVMAVLPDHIVMRTVERRPSGDYPDEHVVWIDDAECVPGDRIKVMGTITTDPDDMRVLKLVADPGKMKEHTSKLDTNIARVTGKLDRNFEFFAAVSEENRRAFGNLLLVVNESFYIRGVILQGPAAIATERSKKYRYGAIVQIEGRIQTREYVQNQGSANAEDRVALEIVVNNAEVITPAASTDPFEEFDKETEAAL